RKERLCRSRVISQGELEESRTDWELKKQACEEAAAALDIFGIRPDEVKLGEPLIVRAPISGKIVSDNLTIGQYVKEDSEPLAVIADLSTVWVVANIKERDLANVSKLEKADIRFVAVPDSAFTGRIFHISDMLDAESRAVEAIIECDNPDGALRPHMFATVSFHCSPRQAIVIPASAVLQDEDCTYVIKKTGDHSFRKVTVKVSENNGGLCAVSSGISEGDVILTKGAFYFLEF
ncbi:MAG: efflux RND transporter periplasmic adaptor subunit, partial [Muribaculaceae bacterium]|nr:efflux RND transporter periplasmic adaptor subunit [Muribaculaceae bacterium]